MQAVSGGTMEAGFVSVGEDSLTPTGRVRRYHQQNDMLPKVSAWAWLPWGSHSLGVWQQRESAWHGAFALNRVTSCLARAWGPFP
jgi:hypothetical protein